MSFREESANSAAVLRVDVVGFRHLLGEFEVRGLQFLRSFTTQFRKIVVAENGNFEGSLGDRCYATFLPENFEGLEECRSGCPEILEKLISTAVSSGFVFKELCSSFFQGALRIPKLRIGLAHSVTDVVGEFPLVCYQDAKSGGKIKDELISLAYSKRHPNERDRSLRNLHRVSSDCCDNASDTHLSNLMERLREVLLPGSPAAADNIQRCKQIYERLDFVRSSLLCRDDDALPSVRFFYEIEAFTEELKNTLKFSCQKRVEKHVADLESFDLEFLPTEESNARSRGYMRVSY